MNCVRVSNFRLLNLLLWASTPILGLFLCLMTFLVECPYSTYKDFTGYAKSCIACPANSRHSRIGSRSRADCHCIDGYEGNPAGYVECKSKHNPI